MDERVEGCGDDGGGSQVAKYLNGFGAAKVCYAREGHAARDREFAARRRLRAGRVEYVSSINRVRPWSVFFTPLATPAS